MSSLYTDFRKPIEVKKGLTWAAVASINPPASPNRKIIYAFADATDTASLSIGQSENGDLHIWLVDSAKNLFVSHPVHRALFVNQNKAIFFDLRPTNTSPKFIRVNANNELFQINIWINNNKIVSDSFQANLRNVEFVRSVLGADIHDNTEQNAAFDLMEMVIFSGILTEEERNKRFKEMSSQYAL